MTTLDRGEAYPPLFNKRSPADQVTGRAIKVYQISSFLKVFIIEAVLKKSGTD
jgi:hypothetical protein